MFHQRIDPPHRVGCPDDPVFGTKNEKETVAGVGQPTFIDQPRRSCCEISGSNGQRSNRFFSGEIAPPMSKTIVEILLQRQHSRIIRKNLRKTTIFAYDLGHSHSIVAGGFPEMSYVTREIPFTSLQIR